MTERTIFLAALQIRDPAKRLAYLEQACAGDAALRRQVEVLLAAHPPQSELTGATALVQQDGDVGTQAVTSDQPAEAPTQQLGEDTLAFLAPGHEPGSLG